MSEATKLLLVEDDLTGRAILAEGLSIEGFEVFTAENMRLARHQIEHKRPDLMLLDLNLPDGSGYHLLKEVRAADGLCLRVDPALPIVVLSGRCSEVDRVRGFRLGCDDYVTKPFSFAELAGRIDAVLRRVRRPAVGSVSAVAELRIDHRTRSVTLAGRPVTLTGKEYALLTALASDPARVFTKEDLLRSVWGYMSIGSTRTLDSHACRLRGKLSGGQRRYVVNLWGTGYRLVDDLEPTALESTGGK